MINYDCGNQFILFVERFEHVTSKGLSQSYFVNISRGFLDPHCGILIVRIASYIKEYESVSDRVAKERHGRPASVLLVTIGLDRARSSALTRHRQNSTV